MNYPRPKFAVAMLAGIAAALAPVVTLRAADQTPQQAAALLTSAQWMLHKHPRVFQPDGRYFTKGVQIKGTWKIENGALVITVDGTTEGSRFPLPLNPAGTWGTDQNGTAEDLAMIGTPSASPATYAAVSSPALQTPLPAGAASPAIPAGTSTPVPEPPARLDDSAEHHAALLVTTNKWMIHGRLITFKPDGTFTSTRVRSSGIWRIAGSELEVNFGNTIHHFPLPLNPAGTHGVDDKGKPQTITMAGAPPATAAAAPSATAQPATPAAGQSEQQAIALLTSGAWKFHGHVRTFNADGTFGSDDGSSGSWKIADGELHIVFSDNKDQHNFSLPLIPSGTHGVDPGGKPEDLVRVVLNNNRPVARAAVPADIQQQAAAVLQSYHGSLVLVTGSAGAGSGFVATMGGANWLFTNIHVAAGLPDATYRTLDGNTLQGAAPQIAQGEDIFAMALPATFPATAFQILQNVASSVAVGDWVVVLGNAGGGGVANTIIGKVTGVGPDLVEVDAPFVPGNSGSPIIHLKTGKVIGAATYVSMSRFDLATYTVLKAPAIRRFGYRLDTVAKWTPVNRQSFESQAAILRRIELATDNIGRALWELYTDKSPDPVWDTNHEIQDRVSRWRDERSHTSNPQAVKDADTHLLNFFKQTCEADIKSAQDQVSYDFFTRQMTIQKQIRDGLEKVAEHIIRTGEH